MSAASAPQRALANGGLSRVPFLAATKTAVDLCDDNEELLPWLAGDSPWGSGHRFLGSGICVYRGEKLPTSARLSAEGSKGYVTNIGATALDGPAVVAAYRNLWQVETTFRMAKSDLAARPIFHRIRDSIEAHLTVVFAIARTIQTRTGISIKKFLQTLRPLQSAVINTGTQIVTIPLAIPPEAQDILETLPGKGGH